MLYDRLRLYIIFHYVRYKFSNSLDLSIPVILFWTQNAAGNLIPFS